MADILPRELPAAATVPPTASLISDNGVTVEKATPLQITGADTRLFRSAIGEVALPFDSLTSAEGKFLAVISSTIKPVDPPAGPIGPAGPADNTYDDLADFKAQDITNKAARMVGATGVVDGSFNWTLGDFTGLADDEDIIKADSTALSVGAWVRQNANSVTSLQSGAGAIRRPAQAEFQDTVTATQFGAAGDGVTLDNAAITAAMTAHESVLLPHGTYLIKDLAMLSGRTIRGQGVGATIIKFDPTGFRPFVMSGLSNIEISDLTIDANGCDFDVMLFTSCTNVRVKNVAITNSLGNGITADACSWCLFQDLDFYDTGGDSSDSCIYLKNPTGDGLDNQVINVRFRGAIIGRGLFGLGQKRLQVATLKCEMTNGEGALFEDCEDGEILGIDLEGPGTATSSLSDGVAFNACARMNCPGFNIRNSSGHALSANGQLMGDGVTPKTGTHDCVFGPGIITSPNEVGVAFSDQSVSGSFPARNRAVGITVYNAGQKVNNPAFDCCGTDNHMTACTARDDQGSPTTTWGFRELNSANVPARNTFSGQFLGSFITAKYAVAVNSSSVEEELGRVTTTKVTFDGDTGGTATIVAGSDWNIASVTRDGEGNYIINTNVALPPWVGVVGQAISFAGYNVVVLDQILSPTSYRVMCLAGGTTPNDSTRVFVEFR